MRAHPQDRNVASADATTIKKIRTVQSVTEHGPRNLQKKSDKQGKAYQDAVRLDDEKIYLWMLSSKVESPFKLYERPEPESDKAIKLMNHIFDKYGNDRYMLSTTPCFVSYLLQSHGDQT